MQRLRPSGSSIRNKLLLSHYHTDPLSELPLLKPPGSTRAAAGGGAPPGRTTSGRRQPFCEQRPRPRLNLQPMSGEAPPRAAAGSGSHRRGRRRAAVPRSPRRSGEGGRRQSGGCPPPGGRARSPRLRPSARCRSAQRNAGSGRELPRGAAGPEVCSASGEAITAGRALVLYKAQSGDDSAF